MTSLLADIINKDTLDFFYRHSDMILLVINIMCVSLIIYMFVFARKKIPGLPNTISMVFASDNGSYIYGRRENLFQFPVIAAVMLVLFNLVAFGNMNYPASLNSENKDIHYYISKVTYHLVLFAEPITPENRDNQYLIGKISFYFMFLPVIWSYFLFETSIVKLTECGETNGNRVILKSLWGIALMIFIVIVFVNVSHIYK